MKRPLWLKRPSGFKLTDFAGKELLWFHDFEQVPRQEILRPIVGQPGTFTQPTGRYYFDELGRYKYAAPGELIWAKSPTGRMLPVIQPAYTNEVVNNSDHNTTSVWQVTFGNAVNWNGFNLREVIPTTYAGSHNTWRNYSGSKLINGAVVCGAYIIKPLVGQTKWAFGCFLTGGTTQRNLNVTFDLDGTPPTLPAETTQLKVLSAGSIPISNGYYYVYASFYVKDKEDHTTISVRNFILDSNNNSTYAGDDVTPYALIGADGLYFDMIHPPLAPVSTSGSAVTVSQDQLTFPFTHPFPAEGLTFALEVESAFEANILSGTPIGATLGDINTSYGYYSPLGFSLRMFYGGVEWYIYYLHTLTSLNDNKLFRTAYQFIPDISKTAIDLEAGATSTATENLVSAGWLPKNNAILFRFAPYANAGGPFWLKRYAIVKGIVDPEVLL